MVRNAIKIDVRTRKKWVFSRVVFFILLSDLVVRKEAVFFGDTKKATALKTQPILTTLVTIRLVAISATCQVWRQSDFTLQKIPAPVSAIDGKVLARLNSLPVYRYVGCGSG